MRKHLVAIGDSFTVGIGDEVEGAELKSWVEYLSELYEPKLEYTNLARRGLITKQIRTRQLDKAIKLQPDVVSIISGANDILKGYWSRKEYEKDMEYMIEALSKSETAIIIANLPDFTVRLPMPVEQKEVVKKQLIEANEVIQALSDKFKLIHFDFWNHPISNDPAFWSKDLIHPNSKGYREIANMIYDRLATRKNEVTSE